MKKNILWIALFLGFVAACSSKKEVSGFDKEAWKKDRMACADTRKAMFETLVAHKELWLGLDDDEVMDLLGRPERSFYYERNVRCYSYYGETGKQCDSSKVKDGKRVTLEFNATGFVKRIYVEY